MYHKRDRVDLDRVLLHSVSVLTEDLPPPAACNQQVLTDLYDLPTAPQAAAAAAVQALKPLDGYSEVQFGYRSLIELSLQHES